MQQQSPQGMHNGFRSSKSQEMDRRLGAASPLVWTKWEDKWWVLLGPDPRFNAWDYESHRWVKDGWDRKNSAFLK